MSLYQIDYDFQPGDSIWVVNKTEQSIHHGICIQVEVRIYQDATGLPAVTPTPTPPIIDHLFYRVLLDNQIGTVKVLPEDAFFTLAEALIGLSGDITPTPTPTPTSTPTVTPTTTFIPSPTPTSTPTVTPTFMVTP